MSFNIGKSSEEFLKLHGVGSARAGISNFVAPKAVSRAGISTGGIQEPTVQKFVTLPTEDILTVITGRALRNGCDGLYNVCDQMTGETHWTHHLPEAARQCSEVLTERFPHLGKIKDEANVFFEKFDKEKKNFSDRQINGKIRAWTKKQQGYIGKEMAVPTFTENADAMLAATKRLFGFKG